MEKVEQVTSARVLDPDSIKVFPVTLTGKNKRPQWKYIYHEMNYRQQVTQRHVCNKNYRSLIWHVISWPPHLPLSSSHTHKNGHSDKAQIYEQTNDILSSSCKSVILCVVFFSVAGDVFFFLFDADVLLQSLERRSWGELKEGKREVLFTVWKQHKCKRHWYADVAKLSQQGHRDTVSKVSFYYVLYCTEHLRRIFFAHL